jgi:hypothetical protein
MYDEFTFGKSASAICLAILLNQDKYSQDEKHRISRIVRRAIMVFKDISCMGRSKEFVLNNTKNYFITEIKNCNFPKEIESNILNIITSHYRKYI